MSESQATFERMREERDKARAEVERLNKGRLDAVVRVIELERVVRGMRGGETHRLFRDIKAALGEGEG